MNAFKGNFTSREACSIAASAFSIGFPEAQVCVNPLADGGDGTIDVLVQALSGKVEIVEVTDPWGRKRAAQVGILNGDTAIVESAQCCGLALAHGRIPEVFTATSRGVGEAMRWAAGRGVKRIIVGIGGTATNDGGIGMAQAAGARILDALGRDVGPGIQGLKQVHSVDLGDIPEVFRGVEVIGISDVKNVLVGKEGATFTYAPQKGLEAEYLLAVDEAMNRYGAILGRDLSRDPRDLPMAGAGGGLGGALWSYFGANLVDGATFIMKETGFFDLIEDADMVITGEGKVDAQTEKGKVPYAVGKAGLQRGVPVIVIGGSLDDSVMTDYPPEFSALFDTTVRPMKLSAALAVSRKTLPFVAEQIARLSRVSALSNPTEIQTSAGGGVIRKYKGKRQVLMIKDRFGVFALPKGHIEPGETAEQAALREVWEETGIQCKIVSYGASHRYRFFGDDGRPVEKCVDYYLMEPLSEVVVPRIGEIADALWVNEDDIEKLDTYPNLMHIVKELLDIHTQIKAP